jgi:hypothetical protein
MEGLSVDDYRILLWIVLKFKPVDYVFRGFFFILNESLWGDTTISWGDSTIQWGERVELDVPLSVNG